MLLLYHISMLFALLLCVILQKNDRRLTFVSGLNVGKADINHHSLHSFSLFIKLRIGVNYNMKATGIVRRIEEYGIIGQKLSKPV